jgi:hypothetical protein
VTTVEGRISTSRRVNYVILLCVVITAALVYLRFGQGRSLEYTSFGFSIGLFVQWAAIGFSALYRAEIPAFTSAHMMALWAAAAYPFLLVDRPEFPAWFVIVSIPLGYAMAFVTTLAADFLLRRIPRWR